MDGLVSVASNAISDVKVLVVSAGGMIAIVYVVHAIIKAGGLVLGAIIRAGLAAALMIALIGGLLFALANSASNDVKHRLGSAGAVIRVYTPPTRGEHH